MRIAREIRLGEIVMVGGMLITLLGLATRYEARMARQEMRTEKQEMAIEQTTRVLSDLVAEAREMREWRIRHEAITDKK